MSRNFGELVDAVVLKDFEAKANIETEVKAWINDGYMKASGRDLRCFRKKTNFNITTASQTYNKDTVLPNYRMMIEMWTSSGPIDFISEERAMAKLYYTSDYSDWDEGCPLTAWIEAGTTLYFYPKIDTTYTVYAYYYHVPDLMVDDDDTHVIPANKEELLVNYAKILYDFREKDWSAVDRQTAMFERELELWEIADAKISKTSSNILELQRQYNSTLKGRRARIWP